MMRFCSHIVFSGPLIRMLVQRRLHGLPSMTIRQLQQVDVKMVKLGTQR